MILLFLVPDWLAAHLPVWGKPHPNELKEIPLTLHSAALYSSSGFTTHRAQNTCTSWAAPEELLQDPALDKEWGFPLAEQLWKQKKKEFCSILWQIIKIAALPLRTCADPTDHRACAVLSDKAQRPKYFSSATSKPQGTKRNSSEHLPPGQCRARLLVLGSLKMHFKPKTDLIPA